MVGVLAAGCPGTPEPGPEPSTSCPGPLDDNFEESRPQAWRYEEWTMNQLQPAAPGPEPANGLLEVTTDDYTVRQLTSAVPLPNGTVTVMFVPRLASGGQNADFVHVLLATDADSLTIAGGGGVRFHDGGAVDIVAPGVSTPVGSFLPGERAQVTLSLVEGLLSASVGDDEAVEVARIANAPFLILAVGNSTDGASFEDVSSTQPCASQ